MMPEEDGTCFLPGRFRLSYDGHDKPYPTWYPYAFVGALAVLGAAYFVFG